jgi:DDE superfamily endonuclease
LAGLVCKTRRSTPRWTPEHCLRRMAFAESHVANRNLKDWIFTDECYAGTNQRGKSEWCRVDEYPTARVRERWQAKIHVWGAVGVDFRYLIVLPKTRVNAQVYQKEVLTKFFDAGVFDKKKHVFQQDGARPHTAASSMEWLKKKKINVVAEWPAYSPDLSPIENVWSAVAKILSDLNPTKDNLQEKFCEAWEKYETTKINNTVLSFASRLSDCIDVNGLRVVR